MKLKECVDVQIVDIFVAYYDQSVDTYGSNSKNKALTRMLWIILTGTSFEIGLRWMPQSTFDEKSILVQAMAWIF